MATRHESHLGALIEQQKRLNGGLSDAQVVARAKARGEKLGKSNIGRVANGDNPSLSRGTIFGLAAGLGVTPATVARAALADMGIILTEPEADSETAIRTDPTLPEQGRRLLLALLNEIKSNDTVHYLPDGSLDQTRISGGPMDRDTFAEMLTRDDLTAE
ncbi:hypothetical protein [Nocardia sp. NPDC019255]|uniref:hypothetical protein n=1 Tax=Nocardia sp. NPDC019255 TaxID=3154591 RepID=UPI00341100E6